MASPNPSAQQIPWSKELTDRVQMTKLGIAFRSYQPLDKWPRHLLSTFQQIQSFNTYNLSNLGVNTIPRENYQSIWADETRDRARRIADVCANLLEEDVSEIEWRLRLEELVLARFRLEIEW
jgi:hypothetical protein